MKEDTNFALIIVGVIAVVAIIGMLNFNNVTGKTTGQSRSIIQSEIGEIYYCNLYDCKEACGKECIEVKTYTGTKAAEKAYCRHNLLSEYDNINYKLKTYYAHYFCG